jgi:AcrR family transcriptional regulator
MAHEIEAPARFRAAFAGTSVAPFERSFGRRFGMAIGQRYDAIRDAARAAFARRGFHQASIREIARTARLSLAGLYHYVGGKDELLFLVVDGALATLIEMADGALAEAVSPEQRLRALIRAHLEFGFRHADGLRVVNRDWEAVQGAHRVEIVAKRRGYIDRWVAVLRDLDPHGRGEHELFSAATVLLGMLNGIAVRPFLKTAEDAGALAGQVGALFLHGFLDLGGGHDG